MDKSNQVILDRKENREREKNTFLPFRFNKCSFLTRKEDQSSESYCIFFKAGTSSSFITQTEKNMQKVQPTTPITSKAEYSFWTVKHETANVQLFTPLHADSDTFEIAFSDVFERFLVQ